MPKIFRIIFTLNFKIILIGLFSISPYLKVKAQSASDVLENGIKVNKRDKLLLILEKNSKTGIPEIFYDLWNDEKTNYEPLKDSVIFMATKGALNVYMRPVNPLNYSQETSIEMKEDLIEKEASEALNNIIGSINRTFKNLGLNKNKCNDEFTDLETSMLNIEVTLKKDQKEEILKLFTKLKGLDFLDESITVNQINKLNIEKKLIESHFKGLKDAIEKLKLNVDEFNCNDAISKFTIKQLFNNIINDFRNVYKNQVIRLEKLNTSFDMVEKLQEEASVNKDGLKWFIRLDRIPAKRGKVGNYTIAINESGYQLSDDKEIVSTIKKEKVRHFIRVRKFDLFIPEVSAGTAYTFLKFPKFNTITDTTGQHFVTEAGEDNVRNINFTSMINFNYFLSNSIINPFLQVGVGANAGYPTFFTGVGFRMNFRPIKRFAFSYGVASTWIKTLDKLNVGDKVAGEAELEKDIKHEFKWPPKSYLGIQVNF